MVEKLTVSRAVFNVCNYVFMALFAFVCIVPLWHVLMASISDPHLLMASSGLLFKPLGQINAELLRRKKEAVLARGQEWVEPEELERREVQQAAALREENRVADLKVRCAQKGLDFDTENARFLEKQARKQAWKKRK